VKKDRTDQFDRVMKRVTDIAEKAVDDTGFIPIRELTQRCEAKIQLRPLLVEAIVARSKSVGIKEWMILLDSERFGDVAQEIEDENATRPLPNRLRNTVAHELAHVIWFNVCGIEPIEKKKADEVQNVEHQIESLSPCLLLPYSKLKETLSREISVDTLTELRNRAGLSSEAFVQRIKMLRFHDPDSINVGRCLENTAIGVGSWKNSKNTTLQLTPIFSRFSHLAPSLLLQHQSTGIFTVSDAFQEPDFYLNGGSVPITNAEISVGTTREPYIEKQRAQLSVEPINKQQSGKYLWTLRLLGASTQTDAVAPLS
jgi:hypothetical protein